MQALTSIGLTWDGALVNPQLELTSQTVDFDASLYGATWIGIHWGAGESSPSPQTPGGVTGFYRLDGLTGLDSFSLAFGSASGARLYGTSAPPTPPAQGPEIPAFDPPLTVLPPADDGPGVGVEDTLPPPNFAPTSDNPLAAAVPEPNAWALMILGLGGVGAALRRRRRLAADGVAVNA
jgi:hypothetical protein